MNEIKNQLKKSLIEFCILAIIAKGEVYSTDILEELKESDLLVVEGTLYPLLSRLKREMYVSHKWVESESGPPRKYYSLTEEGLLRLQSYKDSWNQLSNSVNLLINQNGKTSRSNNS